MSETLNATWERVKAWRAREEKLKAHQVGALFLAYERARAQEISLDMRIEASDYASAILSRNAEAATKRASEARAAFVDELLKL